MYYLVREENLTFLFFRFLGAQLGSGRNIYTLKKEIKVMTKRTKKLLSLLLASAMVFTMNTTDPLISRL